MSRYVAIIFLLLVINYTVTLSSPLRFTIDCSGSDENASSFRTRKLMGKSLDAFKSSFDVESFCTLIHNAIPKTVKDGKFVLVESDMDQSGYSDTRVPIAVAPPEGFVPQLQLPKLRIPKLKIPAMNVPKLRAQPEKHFKMPSIGTTFMEIDEESSAEKMAKFKKGIQKLLHIVKVLGQIDHYISERTRILVDKLSKTFAE